MAVDLRKGSKTYGKWFGVLLSAENKKQFFIPKNFAHGFPGACPIMRSLLTSVPISTIRTMRADFPGEIRDINVQWPIPEGMELTISEKDQHWGSFKEYQEKNK